MSDQYPSRLAEKIVVRLPDGVRDRLAQIAKENRRSVNAEVVDRLLRSLSGATPSDAIGTVTATAREAGRSMGRAVANQAIAKLVRPDSLAQRGLTEGAAEEITAGITEGIMIALTGGAFTSAIADGVKEVVQAIRKPADKPEPGGDTPD